jgi:hypothetical protein
LRIVVAIPLAAVAFLLLALGVVDLATAAFGDTGDTSRDVPLLFGVLFVVFGGLCGFAAAGIWRRVGRSRSCPGTVASSANAAARSK